eukprot:Hpha_TRINITY_DN4527_c0_g1::TRINITY_DN4527_c0_g1_i1::g.115516::m.115516
MIQPAPPQGAVSKKEGKSKHQKRKRRVKDGAGELAVAHSIVCGLLSSAVDVGQLEADNTERDLHFLQFAKRARFRADPSNTLSVSGAMRRHVIMIFSHLRVVARSQEFVCQMVKRFLSGTRRVQVFVRQHLKWRRTEEERILGNWKQAEYEARRQIAHEIELRRTSRRRGAQVERDLLALLCLYHDCWAPHELKLDTLKEIFRSRILAFKGEFIRWKAFIQDHRASRNAARELLDSFAPTAAGGGSVASEQAFTKMQKQQFQEELMWKHILLMKWKAPRRHFSSSQVSVRDCINTCCRLLGEGSEAKVRSAYGSRHKPPERCYAHGKPAGGTAARRWAAYYRSLVWFDPDNCQRLINLFRPTHQTTRSEGVVAIVRPLLLQSDAPAWLTSWKLKRRAEVNTPDRASALAKAPVSPSAADVDAEIDAVVSWAQSYTPRFCGAQIRNAATPPPCPGKRRERPRAEDRQGALRELFQELVSAGLTVPSQALAECHSVANAGTETSDDVVIERAPGSRITPAPAEIIAMATPQPPRRPRSAPTKRPAPPLRRLGLWGTTKVMTDPVSVPVTATGPERVSPRAKRPGTAAGRPSPPPPAVMRTADDMLIVGQQQLRRSSSPALPYPYIQSPSPIG